MSPKPLSGQVALVTGGSRGIAKGVALQLGEAGATVYVTGRPPAKKSEVENQLPSLEKTAEEVTDRGGKGIAVFCDHSDPEQIKALFARIEKEQNGQLDILVNVAFSATAMLLADDGKPFYERDPSTYEVVNQVSLTGSYICAVYAARLMVPRKKGLIVTLSSIGGVRYIFTPAYGIGNAACDRLASDLAHDLIQHNVCSVSIWPGAVETELMKMKEMFVDAESQEFLGKCVVTMATDPKIMDKTGHIVTTVHLAKEYNIIDINGKQPKDSLIENATDHIKLFNSIRAPKVGENNKWLQS
ncbi:hypothetical protein QR680_007905 [Steinernema hermaphroditum]|uniref:Uncharacterized protein n=1 Tax=Steinernema hermaphroditum TaxID=289476 RepID=A0AA39M747_9BILA|nr:hypothetical protein QR680_007905 [Steinernema hermaphroditum]